MKVIHWSCSRDFGSFLDFTSITHALPCVFSHVTLTRGLLILHGYSGKQFFRQVARAITKDKKSDASNSCD